MKGAIYNLPNGNKAIVEKQSFVNTEKWKIEIRDSNDEFLSEEMMSIEELETLSTSINN